MGAVKKSRQKQNMKHYQTTVPGRLFALTAAVLLIAICTPASFAQIPATPASGAIKPAAKVDVNSADLATLETLPGVGPAIAKKIIAGRPYKTLSDLGNVKGLSAAKLNTMKDLLVFGRTAEASTPQAPKAAKTPKALPSEASTASTRSGSATSPASTAGSTVSKLAPGEQLNINTASAADLDKLPGIGPTKAQAIVDYRNQNGDFKSIEDIEKVKGIKGGTFSKIKPYIKVSN
jgi:competence protein ComEA